MKMPVFADPRDYLALAVRRKWWILGSFLVVISLAAFITYSLPDIYVSQATIIVEPRDVPDDLVRDLVSASPEERLNGVRQQILSRTNLLSIINEFENSLPRLQGLDNAEKVVTMRSKIKVEILSDVTNRRTSADITFFTIAFENENPDVAQLVVRRLTSLFIQRDNELRGQRVRGTAEFFQSELTRVQNELQEADTQVRLLKERYRYELPDQIDNNQRALDRLQNQLNANRELLERQNTTRLSLERELYETPAVLEERVMSQGPYEANRAGPSPTVIQYREKQREFEALKARYTSKHPSVRQLEAELARLRETIPPDELVDIIDAPELTSRPNPAYQQLERQLREQRAEINLRERDNERISQEIAKYNQRIQNTPAREQEIAGVLRRYQDLQNEYNDLQRKLLEVERARSLETAQRGSVFRVLDSASLPIRPAKPNRIKLLLMGFGTSLILGCGLALGVDLADQKFWTYSEIESLLNVPVLAEIPAIMTEDDLKKERRKRVLRLALLATLVAGLIGAAVVAYYTPSLNGPIRDGYQILIDWMSS